MVKIRLTLRGKKKHAYYHIVAVDSRKRRDGKVLETLGSYNPHAKKGEKAKVDREKYQAWVCKGAQPTQIVAQIFNISA